MDDGLPYLASEIVVLLVGPLDGRDSASAVRQIEELKHLNGAPGMTHKTLAGAAFYGDKEVEVWLATIASGLGPPIHRHECEEIFIILKGSGTVYIASESQNGFPGEPKAKAYSPISTFCIPSNSVHRVVNTNDEDLQVIAIFSRPPLNA